MAKANLVLPSGAKVTVEGTPEEIQSLLAFYAGEGKGGRPAKVRGRKSRKQGRSPRSPSGPRFYIRELIQEDFFNAKRTLKDVKDKLDEKGHIYPMSTLSARLIDMTRARELRRFKEKDVWVYVKA